jgi:hypothetical protein
MARLDHEYLASSRGPTQGCDYFFYLYLLRGDRLRSHRFPMNYRPGAELRAVEDSRRDSRVAEDPDARISTLALQTLCLLSCLSMRRSGTAQYCGG